MISALSASQVHRWLAFSMPSVMIRQITDSAAGHQDEHRHRCDGGGRVRHLVLGVELSQRHFAVLRLGALDVDELTDSCIEPE